METDREVVISYATPPDAARPGGVVALFTAASHPRWRVLVTPRLEAWMEPQKAHLFQREPSRGVSLPRGVGGERLIDVSADDVESPAPAAVLHLDPRDMVRGNGPDLLCGFPVGRFLRRFGVVDGTTRYTSGAALVHPPGTLCVQVDGPPASWDMAQQQPRHPQGRPSLNVTLTVERPAICPFWRSHTHRGKAADVAGARVWQGTALAARWYLLVVSGQADRYAGASARPRCQGTLHVLDATTAREQDARGSGSFFAAGSRRGGC